MAETSLIRAAEWEAFRSQPNEEHFRPIYDGTRRLVWTICLRVLRDHEDAADAMQSTYCRLLRMIRRPEGESLPADPQQAIYRLALREANSLRMRRRRRAGKEITVEHWPTTPDPQPSAAQLAQETEKRRRLEEIVDALPQRYRLPVLLHYFDGLSHREVALTLGTPVSTVSNRLARAHRQMEGMLRRAGLGGGALLLLAAVEVHAAMLEPPAALTAEAVFRRATKKLLRRGLETVPAQLPTAPRRGFLTVGKASLMTLALLTTLLTLLTLNELGAYQFLGNVHGEAAAATPSVVEPSCH